MNTNVRLVLLATGFSVGLISAWQAQLATCNLTVIQRLFNGHLTVIYLDRCNVVVVHRDLRAVRFQGLWTVQILLQLRLAGYLTVI